MTKTLRSVEITGPGITAIARFTDGDGDDLHRLLVVEVDCWRSVPVELALTYAERAARLAALCDCPVGSTPIGQRETLSFGAEPCPSEHTPQASSVGDSTN
jgi:hypothetical protein